MCFVSKPRDLFCTFNKFPDQLSRVSVMQYFKINYSRFRTNDQLLANASFYFGQNKNLFGIEVNPTEQGSRMSRLLADKAIDDEYVVDNLRVPYSFKQSERSSMSEHTGLYDSLNN